MEKIRVTEATGQLGSELTMALRGRYGAENVIAAGHKASPIMPWIFFTRRYNPHFFLLESVFT